MNPMLKVSAAVLIAAMSVAPANLVFAAAPAGNVVMGQKTDIVPVTTLDPMIGKWTTADITALGKASSVKVLDTKALYTPADQLLISSAETARQADLTKMRAAINADADLKAWFAKQKVDVNRIIGLSDSGGAVNVFLY